MSSIEGFATLPNRAFASRDFTPAEKFVLMWIANKPVGWIVRADNMDSELGLSERQGKTLRRHLRDKGVFPEFRQERDAQGHTRWYYGQADQAIVGRFRYVASQRTKTSYGEAETRADGSFRRSDQRTFPTGGNRPGSKTEVNKTDSIHRGGPVAAPKVPVVSSPPLTDTAATSSAGTSPRSVPATTANHRPAGVFEAPLCDRCRGPVHGYESEHRCPKDKPMCWSCNRYHWGSCSRQAS